MEDVQDETIHRVKRHPLEAIGLALGACFAAGLTLGWLAGRASRSQATEELSWLS